MSIWSLTHPDTPLQRSVCGLSEYLSCPQHKVGHWHTLQHLHSPCFHLQDGLSNPNVTLGSVLGVNPSEDRLACYMLHGLSAIKPDAHMLLFQQLPEIKVLLFTKQEEPHHATQHLLSAQSFVRNEWVNGLGSSCTSGLSATQETEAEAGGLS